MTLSGLDTIMDAAFDLVVASGLSQLTLRPLAQKAGVPLAAVSQALGTKADLVATLVATSIELDAAFNRDWRARMAAMGPIHPQMRALMAQAALDDWISSCRPVACVMIDLVQTCARSDRTNPALSQWVVQAGAFWAEVVFGDPAHGPLALGYILDEAGYSLCGGDNPAYRMLRAIDLQRLVCGILPYQGEEPGWSAQMEACVAMLQPAADDSPARPEGKAATIAAQAAHIIVAGGVEAVTHRAVAQAAGVPPSTVVYHFGSRDALVVAGLHAVITNLHAGLNLAPKGIQAAVDVSRNLVIATSIIAIAAARYPGLGAYALDMRRRRGENIGAGMLDLLDLPTDRGFDRCTAQVLSIALFGMRMIALAIGEPEVDYLMAGFAALKVCAT